MKKFYWKGWEWQTGHPWGIAHPDEKVWYSDSCISDPDENDHITLDIKIEPEKFYDEIRTFSVGVISVNHGFGPGTFTMKCIMPEGTNLWPAVWLTGFKSWPPELDLCEAYTYAKPDYNKNFLMRRFQPNLHYTNKNGKHKMLGPKNTFKCRTDEYGENTFTGIINPEKIEILYNGFRVFRTIKKDIISQFLESGVYPVFNVSVNSSFGMNDYNNYVNGGKKMKITGFNYVPY